GRQPRRLPPLPLVLRPGGEGRRAGARRPGSGGAVGRTADLLLRRGRRGRRGDVPGRKHGSGRVLHAQPGPPPLDGPRPDAGAERLICAGVLGDHPGVRFLLVHAGGYFPYQAGRLRHARTVREELSSAPEDPWAFRGQIMADTITHDRDALSYLVARMGAENLVMGTDLPFDMATPHPVDALNEAVDTETARQVA